jgi:hypothetical protein
MATAVSRAVEVSPAVATGGRLGVPPLASHSMMPPPFRVRRSANAIPCNSELPFTVKVPDGTTTLPWNALWLFSVKLPAETVIKSQSGRVGLPM